MAISTRNDSRLCSLRLHFNSLREIFDADHQPVIARCDSACSAGSVGSCLYRDGSPPVGAGKRPDRQDRAHPAGRTRDPRTTDAAPPRPQGRRRMTMPFIPTPHRACAGVRHRLMRMDERHAIRVRRQPGTAHVTWDARGHDLRGFRRNGFRIRRIVSHFHLCPSPPSQRRVPHEDAGQTAGAGIPEFRF